MTNDVKIAGSGCIAGGEYNKVSISGSGTGTGNFTCKLLKVAGSAKFEGEVFADEVSLAGSVKFQKSIKGNIIKIAGATKIESDISCEELKADGSLIVQGECNVGNLIIEGESSSFNNVYGDSIIIKTKRGKQITVNEIEATNIELRKVKANRVSGETVKITGSSIIDVIEFKESLKISENVEVKKIIKL